MVGEGRYGLGWRAGAVPAPGPALPLLINTSHIHQRALDEEGRKEGLCPAPHSPGEGFSFLRPQEVTPQE